MVYAQPKNLQKFHIKKIHLFWRTDNTLRHKKTHIVGKLSLKPTQKSRASNIYERVTMFVSLFRHREYTGSSKPLRFSTEHVRAYRWSRSSFADATYHTRQGKQADPSRAQSTGQYTMHAHKAQMRTCHVAGNSLGPLQKNKGNVRESFWLQRIILL